MKHTAPETERLALLGAMAAVFAHEVANPLSGISVALEFVRRSLETREFDIGLLVDTLQGTVLDPFELFTTTKPGGSGLGLPLVRQIVSAHNGTINYTSVPGPGHRATFKVLFPAAD